MVELIFQFVLGLFGVTFALVLIVAILVLLGLVVYLATGKDFFGINNRINGTNLFD